MKENTRTSATPKDHAKRATPGPVALAKSKEKKPPTVLAIGSRQRSHAAKTKDPGPHRSAHTAKADVKPIRAEGAKTRSHRRKVTGLENWVPQGPVHVGGVMKRGTQEAVHFAGVENRSPAAHLNDVHAELHPQSAVNPLHGPFPARLKQP